MSAAFLRYENMSTVSGAMGFTLQGIARFINYANPSEFAPTWSDSIVNLHFLGKTLTHISTCGNVTGCIDSLGGLYDDVKHNKLRDCFYRIAKLISSGSALLAYANRKGSFGKVSFKTASLTNLISGVAAYLFKEKKNTSDHFLVISHTFSIAMDYPATQRMMTPLVKKYMPMFQMTCLGAFFFFKLKEIYHSASTVPELSPNKHSFSAFFYNRLVSTELPFFIGKHLCAISDLVAEKFGEYNRFLMSCACNPSIWGIECFILPLEGQYVFKAVNSIKKLREQYFESWTRSNWEVLSCTISCLGAVKFLIRYGVFVFSPYLKAIGQLKNSCMVIYHGGLFFKTVKQLSGTTGNKRNALISKIMSNAGVALFGGISFYEGLFPKRFVPLQLFVTLGVMSTMCHVMQDWWEHGGDASEAEE